MRGADRILGPAFLCLVHNLTSCLNHPVQRRMMPLGWLQEVHYSFQKLREDMTAKLTSCHKGSTLESQKGFDAAIHQNTTPRKSMLPILHTHIPNTHTHHLHPPPTHACARAHTQTHTKVPFSHCTARVKHLCARASSWSQI